MATTTLAPLPGRAGAPDLDDDPAARLARARAALGRAEAAAGLRTRLGAVSAAPAASPDALTGPAAASSLDRSVGVSSEPVAGAAAGRATGVSAPVLPDTPDRAVGHVGGTFPVPDALAPLFPGGVLSRGSVVQVAGSTSLVLALAAAASQEGAWCALAALPHVGWRAAAGAGLDLDRVAAVPAPGPDAVSVVGALVDGFDVLVVGRSPALTDRDRRLVAARIRTRGAVLLSTHPWPGAHVVLQATRPAWQGLGQGWGHLVEQELTVCAAGRAGAARSGEVRVRVGPDGVRPPAGEPLGPARPVDARSADAGSVGAGPVPTGGPLDVPLLRAV